MGKHVCLFYIEPSPKQGTTLYLLMLKRKVEGVGAEGWGAGGGGGCKGVLRERM